MLKLDLARLWNEGRVELAFSIGLEEEGFWSELDLVPARPLVGKVRATATVTRDVVLVGDFKAELARECRRCVTPLRVPISGRLDLLFTDRDELEDEVSNGEVLGFSPGAVELDLTGTLREEVLLAVPVYVLCSEDCKGLCSHCGTELNEGQCDCVRTEEDPRWGPLQALKHE